ncbi:Alpha/Beta hydrolase protein [Terfezia claveryi]|nr:Alpha/Beta hydrolase protein [Terfezia claveryi]
MSEIDPPPYTESLAPRMGDHCTSNSPLDPSIQPTGEIIRPMNQAHADKFASEGFLVVMPDLFHGDPVPSTPAFSKKEIEKTMPIVEKVVKAIKEAYPENAANGVYTIGYCFGGKYVLKLAATDDIKAGALAHGTLVTLKDIKEVRQPVSFACVEGDPFFPDEVRDNGRRYLEDLKVPNEFKLYRGVPHGFAVLGHENRSVGCKPAEVEAIKQAQVWAHDQMLNWLVAH